MRERQLVLTMPRWPAAAQSAQPRPPRVVKNVLTAPKSAIVQQGRRDWCLVLTDQGIEQRPITVGPNDGSNVEVRTGVTAGDRVLLYPDQVLPPSRGPRAPGR